MRRTLALSCLAVFAVTMSACGSSSGPLVLSLATDQRASGENRLATDSMTVTPDFAGLTVTYEAVGDLDAMPTEASAWSIAKYGEAMRETQRLADAFGLNAKATRSENDKYEFVAVDDSTGATVTLWNHLAIGGWWSYWTDGDTAVSSPGCAPDVEDCERPMVDEPRPATDLLTPDEAIARAEGYLDAAGIEPVGYVLSASSTPWSTDVTGVLELDGVESNVMVMFSFADGGELSYASGPVFSVTRADTYPLITVTEALERMSEPRFGFFGAATAMATDIASIEAGPDSTTPVPVTVPITGVRLTLMETNLDNATHMLLPAFTFQNADGDVGTVLAIADEFLVFPDLDQTDPGQIEPAPGGTIEPLNTDSAGSLVGLTEDEALATATERGWQLRVAQRDDENFMLSADYRQDRVNIVVKDGIVTSVEIG